MFFSIHKRNDMFVSIVSSSGCSSFHRRRLYLLKSLSIFKTVVVEKYVRYSFVSGCVENILFVCFRACVCVSVHAKAHPKETAQFNYLLHYVCFVNRRMDWENRIQKMHTNEAEKENERWSFHLYASEDFHENFTCTILILFFNGISCILNAMN